VISARDAAALRRRFFEDVANGLIRIVALTSEHYEKARELIERHGASHRLHTLDSLQLAVAMGLYRAGVVEDMVAADKVMCRVAAVEGMPIIDPEVLPM
jgi:hypothetical protein